MPIDDTIEFRPLRIAVLAISDTRTLVDDLSGAWLAEALQDAGHELFDRVVVRDEQPRIEEQLRKWIASEADVILTTGGTGVTGRDVTPEALEAVQEKSIPGFGELFRWLSYQSIGTSTIQSRACAGVAGGTYIFCLPGSRGAVRDAWSLILKTQLDTRFRPCNFAELIGRLQE